MRKEEIKTAALNLFISNGYEATSTTLIAQAVDLKKQSLYSHYKNKDDIFISIIQDAKEDIIDYYSPFLKKYNHDKYPDLLNDLLLSIIENYKQNSYFKFWIRMSFYPPEHLYDLVQKDVDEIFFSLEKYLNNVFSEMVRLKLIPPQNVDTLVYIYFSFINTIIVDLVYGYDQKIEDKIVAAVDFFWRGLMVTNSKEGNINE